MTNQTLKRRLPKAAEDAIFSYRQMDGTNFIVGELLPQGEEADFKDFIIRTTETNLGEGAVVSLSFVDEQSFQMTASQGGDSASGTYRYELGGGFDLDGDGELG